MGYCVCFCERERVRSEMGAGNSPRAAEASCPGGGEKVSATRDAPSAKQAGLRRQQNRCNIMLQFDYSQIGCQPSFFVVLESLTGELQHIEKSDPKSHSNLGAFMLKTS